MAAAPSPGASMRAGLDPAVGDARTVAPPTAILKFVGWNCRGKGRSLANSRKMEYLARLMYSTGAQVTFVSETRSSKCTASQLNARFTTTASFVVSSEGLSGSLGAFGYCGLMMFFFQSSSPIDILS